MAISKQAARKVKQAVLAGDEQITQTLSATGSVVLEITGPAQKITLQSSDTLAFTYAVSSNGKNFATPVSVAANVPGTYNGPDLVAAVMISWTSGSGKVTMLAV